MIVTLTANPSVDRTVEVALAFDDAGVDVLELGVPFSDPLADGPVIQRASDRALRAGTRLVDVLEVVRRIRARCDLPLLLFSYFNPLLRYGLDARYLGQGNELTIWVGDGEHWPVGDEEVVQRCRPRKRTGGSGTRAARASTPCSWPRPPARTSGSARWPWPRAASCTR